MLTGSSDSAAGNKSCEPIGLCSLMADKMKDEFARERLREEDGWPTTGNVHSAHVAQDKGNIVLFDGYLNGESKVKLISMSNS